MPDPSPLPAGTLLSERFEIVETLGRGGFGIAYRAVDRVRADEVVIKELAPAGTIRTPSGILELGENGDRLRQRFLDEARLLGRLDVRGILPVRASFSEFGTAFFVTEHVPGARTLEQIIRQEGRMTEAGALDVFFQILETLEAIHAKGVLHRDIKPSNVLINERGTATLIDFGSAREWHVDSDVTHTIQYTPGYAPPEQHSERARRGPATDIYALCATLYHALAGAPPLAATDRVAGARYIPLGEQRPDVDAAVATTVDRGLALNYAERPQNAAEVRTLLEAPAETAKRTSIAVIDDLLYRLDRFTFNRRACPACGGLLVEARPLKRGTCPVCRDGTIRRREIHERLCPVCRAGVLHRFENKWPVVSCPGCGSTRLTFRRKGLLSSEWAAACPSCETRLEGVPESLRLVASPVMANVGEESTAEGWQTRSGRAFSGKQCDGCGAQFDDQQDGRLLQISPEPSGRFQSLYPEEWARVASGLEPGAGNAVCDVCEADYYLESDRLTLLGAKDDPTRFAAVFGGRLLLLEDVRWLGAGKESGNPGQICDQCPTEFDSAGEYMRLVRTSNVRLARFVGQPRTPEDWHRVGQGLPGIAEEDTVRSSIEEILRTAYRAGDLGFDAANTIVWKGPAERDGLDSTLLITDSEASFGGMLRRWRVPIDAIESCAGEGAVLELRLSGYREPVVFNLSPLELVIHLKSGERAIKLDADDLCARLGVPRADP